jgi:hypothetical protein
VADEDQSDPRDWLRMLVRLGASVPVRLVANALVGYAAPKMTCNPRYSTLAGITGYSARTVQRHVEVMEEARTVAVTAQYGPRGQQVSNAFTFVWPEDEPAAAAVFGQRWAGPPRQDLSPSPTTGPVALPPTGPVRVATTGPVALPPTGPVAPSRSHRKPVEAAAEASRSAAAAAADDPSPDDITRAVAIREAETRDAEARGRKKKHIENWDGWRHTVREKLERDPAEVRRILAGAKPTLAPAAEDWRRRMNKLADAEALRDMAVASRARDLCAAIRDGRAETPDETPDEVLEQIRDELRRVRGEEHAA